MSTGSITVSHLPDQSALRVIVRFPRLNALPTIIARIRRMFDLSAEPQAIASALSTDPVARAAGCGSAWLARAGRLGWVRDRRSRGAGPADYAQRQPRNLPPASLPRLARLPMA